MRIRRLAGILIVLAPLSVFADSFSESLLHDQLLSDNAGIENQALSRLPLLTPEEQRQLVPRLIQALQSHDAQAPRAAAALAVLGPAAEVALPELVDALHIDEEAVTSGVAQTIVKVGPASVKLLQKATHDPNFLVRRRSAEILGKLGSPAKRAAPDLVLLLDDTQPEVSAAAQNALIHLGAEAVPALSAALRTAGEGNRQALVAVLGKCGNAAAPVLISELKKDENGFVRAQTATVLGQVSGAADTIVPALVGALGDLDDGVRSAAADALGQLGANAKAALGPLAVSAREDKEPLVRHTATEAILAIAKADHDPASLITVLKDPDDSLREKAIQALETLGPAGLPGLIQALQDSDGVLSDEAAKAIVSIGAAAIPLLEPIVSGSDAAAAKRAAAMIRRIRRKQHRAA